MVRTPLRVGVAGAGMIARVHVDAARRAGARMVGISASSPERGAAAAEELGVERAFRSEELMVSDEVDVVHICTPNHLHRPLAELALRAGKHVVCEKPLATSGDDALALDQLARRTGQVAAVPFVYRYHPMAAEARARVRSGGVGDVRLIHGHYLQDWLSERTDHNWRVSAEQGGPSRAFADIGSHWCDLVEWVTGHRISELAAMTDSVFDDRTTEDSAQVLFRTDRGASGSVVVSQVSPGRKNRLWFEVDGARASVAFDQESPESLLVGSRGRTELVRRDAPALSAGAARLSVVPAGHPMGYNDCFAAFVAEVYATVRSGGDPEAGGFPTFADAARSARITDTVLAAARAQTWTKLS